MSSTLFNYTYDEWEVVVFEEMRNGYFQPRLGDRIICKNINCNKCKYNGSGCPDIGVGSTKGLGIMEHKMAVYEFYPEVFMSWGKLGV